MTDTPKFKQLNNTNYGDWNGEMKAWLMKLGLWKLVSGREKKPRDAEKLEIYEDKAEKAAGEIYLAVEQDQRVHIKDLLDDPVAIWSKLETVHVSKKAEDCFNAYSDLLSIAKKDDESLNDLGVRVANAMSLIKNLRPKDYTIEKLDADLECMALIRALSHEYATLSTSLLLVDSLDKDKVLQAFRAEELNRQKQSETAAHVQAKAPNGQYKKPNSNSNYKGKGNNTNSGNNGNTGNTNNGSGNNGNDTWQNRFGPRMICQYCGNSGHWMGYCPSNPHRIVSKQQSGGSLSTGGNNANRADANNVVESAGNASIVSEHVAYSTQSDIFHWNIDTGATSHMTPDHNWICNYKSYKVPIKLADNRIIYSAGIGTVAFMPIINGKNNRQIEFTRVLHVPELQTNLLAVLYLTKLKGLNVHIWSNTIYFNNSERNLLFTATINDYNVAYLNGMTLDITESASLASTLPLDLTLWHRRLCHHNLEDINQLVKNSLAEGLVIDSKAKPDPICEPCLAGKMHANPFPSTEHRATKVLELIHSDVHDVGVSSISGYRYWITFIDDYARFRVVIPMKRKSDTFDAFKRYKAWAENSTGCKIKVFRCDKGGEYVSNNFIEYLNARGIERQYSCRNRPQQNGVAEGANRVLAERITAMLNESGLPRTFWADCLAAIVHVWNRLPTSAVYDSTPYQKWYKSKPSVGHIRVWGCVAYVHVQKDKRTHLGSHYEKCIFIGYPDGYKGWKFYNPTTKKVVISERADFDERYMYYNKSLSIPPTNTTNPEPSGDSNEYNYTPGHEYTIQHKKPTPTVNPNNNLDNTTALGHHEQSDSNISSSSEDDETDQRPLAVRRPRRNVRPPGEWWKAREPTPAISDTDEESDQSANVVVAGEFEPPTYKQAMKDQHANKWKDAMADEINAHLENETWSIVQLPPGQKAIGSKWVYHIKHKADGSIEQFKARLVAQGFSQRPGFDYTETFASTIRAASIRTVLALAAVEDLHLCSVDISHAFINSDIDTEIYMKQPEGFSQNGPEYVCKLNKSLYGLKQSPW